MVKDIGRNKELANNDCSVFDTYEAFRDPGHSDGDKVKYSNVTKGIHSLKFSHGCLLATGAPLTLYT